MEQGLDVQSHHHYEQGGGSWRYISFQYFCQPARVCTSIQGVLLIYRARMNPLGAEHTSVLSAEFQW